VKLGAWCTLFALALQFAVSFGHVHGPAGALALVDLGPSADSSSAADSADAPAPLQKAPGLAFDFCAICAATGVTGNALLAAVPSLPVPADRHPSAVWPEPAASAPASPPRLFQARAPPRA
jgi:hypothetical protein